MFRDAPHAASLLLDQRQAFASREWLQWFRDLVTAVVQVVEKIALTSQAASLATTTIVTPTAAGVYRVSWYTRVTQAATTSSSLTITVGWTQSGVALTSSGAAITGNTTTTWQTGSIVVRSDKATGITYATAYSSSGATAMNYALDVVLERLGR